MSLAFDIKDNLIVFRLIVKIALFIVNFTFACIVLILYNMYKRKVNHRSINTADTKLLTKVINLHKSCFFTTWDVQYKDCRKDIREKKPQFYVYVCKAMWFFFEFVSRQQIVPLCIPLLPTRFCANISFFSITKKW